MKFTTLSSHIGDNNHLYEVGEPREVEEQNTVLHLVKDKVLGDYDEAAEAAWKTAQEAKVDPVTKIDADRSTAALAEASSTDHQATISALTTERDEARDQLTGMTGERDSARGDLAAAQDTIASLTAERDGLQSDLAAAKAPAGRGRNA